MRYSNRRSGYSKTPFEISAEFRLREHEMADRENFPQELELSPNFGDGRGQAAAV
jgi:hypothetical protein